MNDAWEYRKNLGKVGENCEHGVWWSMDCKECKRSKDGEE